MGTQLKAPNLWRKVSTKLHKAYWNWHRKRETGYYDIAKVHRLKLGKHAFALFQMNKGSYFGFNAEVSWNGGAGYCVREDGKERVGKTLYFAMNCRYRGEDRKRAMHYHSVLPFQVGVTNNWNTKPMVIY